MKKKTMILLVISLLMAFGNAEVINAKKLMYLGHQYDGKVNDQNIPEGKGKIVIGELTIGGMFNGKTINDATFKTDWLKYDGVITYDREDAVTLKKGGAFTLFYYIKEEIHPIEYQSETRIQLDRLTGKAYDVKEELDEDLVITKDSLYNIILKLPFKFEPKGIPAELNPPSIVNKKAEYNLRKYGIEGDYRGEIYAYIVSNEKDIECFVKDYKDEEGRSWSYIGEYKDVFGRYKRDMSYLVSYPDDCQYTSSGSWLVAYPDTTFVKFINSDYTGHRILFPFNGKTYKSGEGIAVKNLDEVATRLSDFIRYQSENKKIQLQSGVIIIVPESKKTISVSEMEKYLQDNLFSVVQISNLFSANVFAYDEPKQIDPNSVSERDSDYIGKVVDKKFIPKNK